MWVPDRSTNAAQQVIVCRWYRIDLGLDGAGAEALIGSIVMIDLICILNRSQWFHTGVKILDFRLCCTLRCGVLVWRLHMAAMHVQRSAGVAGSQGYWVCGWRGAAVVNV
jgi:hypothetical protein